MTPEDFQKLISIPIDNVALEGMLAIPEGAKGLVIFSHGSGSSRLSPRNNFVAEVIRNAGLGTLLFDLLTREEDTVYETRFNIPLLTERLKATTKGHQTKSKTKNMALGNFG